MLRVDPWKLNSKWVSQWWIWNRRNLNIEIWVRQWWSFHLRRKVNYCIVRSGVRLKHNKGLFETFVSGVRRPSYALIETFILAGRTATISIFIISIVTLLWGYSFSVSTFFDTNGFEGDIIDTRETCHYLAGWSTSVSRVQISIVTIFNICSFPISAHCWTNTCLHDIWTVPSYQSSHTVRLTSLRSCRESITNFTTHKKPISTDRGTAWCPIS